MARPVEFNQVQGIVRFGYRKLTECCYLVLAIQDAAAAKQWLSTAPVTDAVTLPDAPDTALQIAFTHDGLARLGCAPELLEQFSLEFRSGLGDSDARARLLGDVGGSAPEHWEWGAGDAVADMLLMLYARPGKLAAFKKDIQSELWGNAFRLVADLVTSDLGGIEPFGFPDGLSQPEVDWERQRTPRTTEDTYTNRIALGEFLLGYPNEYNRYTVRPLLPAESPAADRLPEAEEEPALRDFGRNGTYLVLRTLEQDVLGFWNFVRAQSHSEAEAQTLAEAMVGRKKDGEPLALPSPTPIPGVAPTDRLNSFRFDADPDGLRCPFGAHVRRANPRNGDLPSPPVTGLRRLLTRVGLQRQTLQADAKASSRFHRILRRGREYGPGPQSQDGNGRSGLHFICVGASIARQFEFLQNAWVTSTKFDAMAGESDPLLGSRENLPGTAPTNIFSIPVEHERARKVCDLPGFVTVRGGGYFFLPSIPALRYLATVR